MPFKEFTIDYKKAEVTCNARVWLKNNTEAYCKVKANVKGERCERHTPRTSKEREAELIASLSRKAIIDRVRELSLDDSNFTELDDEILGLAAIIDDLESIYHHTKYADDRAETIAKLKKIKSELIERKVNMDYKARVIMDADSIWSKISDIIDGSVADLTLRYKLKDQVMKVLDTAVESGAAESKA